MVFSVKFSRLIAIALCLAMVAIFFSACNGNKANGENSDTNTGNTNTDSTDNGASDMKDEKLCDYENVDLSQYIQLGAYKNITVEIDKITVTDDEVNKEIDNLLLENDVVTKVTDRVAKEGDIVVVDYTGYMDGEKFSGGEATNVKIELVDDSGYIDGFAEGIVGHTPGEEFSVNVTFPENYGYAAYAGKPAEFVFKFHYIIEYAVTDEFASEYSKGECTSADGFAAYLKDELYKIKYEDAVYSALWQKIKDSSTVIAYPEDSVSYYLAALKVQCQNLASQLGMTYENVLAYMQITEDTLTEYAHNYTKEDLLTYQIAKSENYLPTDEDIDSFSLYYATNNLSSLGNEMLASGYSQDAINVESAAVYAKENHAQYIRLECLRTKVSAFLVSNNTVTEK